MEPWLVLDVIDILREVTEAERRANGWTRAEFERTVSALKKFLKSDHDALEDEDWAWFESAYGLAALLWAEAPLLLVTTPVKWRLPAAPQLHEVEVDDLDAPRIYVTADVVRRFPELAVEYLNAEPGPCVLSIVDFAASTV